MDLKNIKPKVGPFSNSNWVVRNKLIVGAYPYNIKKEKSYIRRLRKVGVNIYISLQSEDELAELESYLPDLNEDEKYYNFPMVDRKTSPDEETISFLNKVLKLIKKENTCLYIHCLGGHGRTGVFVALILSHLYKLDLDKSLSYTQRLHNERYPDEDLDTILSQKINKHNAKYFSPQTRTQILQVKRLCYKPEE